MDTRKVNINNLFVVFIGLFVLLFHTGCAIRCFSCDVTSAASYADANSKCNQAGGRECPSNEDSACMLEGFLRETNTVRVSKKCMRGCPLYINTTAEVVRCCTDDGCNAKFEPMPARRLGAAPRGYNPNRGYNVPTAGGNRQFQNPNTVEIKRLDEDMLGQDHEFPADENMINKPSKTAVLPKAETEEKPTQQQEEVTKKTADIPKPEPNPKAKNEKPGYGKKKLERKLNNERNSLAEQKAKKEAAKHAGNGAATVTFMYSATGQVLLVTVMNIVLCLGHVL